MFHFNLPKPVIDSGVLWLDPPTEHVALQISVLFTARQEVAFLPPRTRGVGVLYSTLFENDGIPAMPNFERLHESSEQKRQIEVAEREFLD